MSNKAEYGADQGQSREVREARRIVADADFDDARAIAGNHGLRLVRCSESHYQLSCLGQWLVNLYPGNCRIYGDRNWPKRPPFVNMAGVRWTLVQVVTAFAESK